MAGESMFAAVIPEDNSSGRIDFSRGPFGYSDEFSKTLPLRENLPSLDLAFLVDYIREHSEFWKCSFSQMKAKQAVIRLPSGNK